MMFQLYLSLSLISSNTQPLRSHSHTHTRVYTHAHKPTSETRMRSAGAAVCRFKPQASRIIPRAVICAFGCDGDDGMQIYNGIYFEYHIPANQLTDGNDAIICY